MNIVPQENSAGQCIVAGKIFWKNIINKKPGRDIPTGF